MPKIAIFPGSFDPVTKGHESLVLRALSLFDTVIVAIGNNATKSYMFPVEKRKKWLEQTFSKHKQVIIENYEGLTVDFCRKRNAEFILRGIRSAADYDYERSIAQVNKVMLPEIETILMFPLPEYAEIRSNILKEIIRHGGKISRFIPDAIELI